MSLLLTSLGFFVNFAAGTLNPEFRVQSLTVHIMHDEVDSEIEVESADQVDSLRLRADATVANTSTVPEEESPVTHRTLPPDEQPVAGWQNMIAETVAVIGKEKQRREETRASMWRRTHSIMFQPASAIVLKQQEPVIPNFQFKPQIHVAGLGVTIGSCFIGIPIVGVPVQDRAVAVRLFVCAKDAG